jgi:hypothetical protein
MERSNLNRDPRLAMSRFYAAPGKNEDADKVKPEQSNRPFPFFGLLN